VLIGSPAGSRPDETDGSAGSIIVCLMSNVTGLYRRGFRNSGFDWFIRNNQI
jgi:hypothetical protein